jgi:hypothetical protein
MTKAEINRKINELETQQYEADIRGFDDRSYELGCKIFDLLQEIPEDE